jgi:uncharacterized protein (DUF1330 family)
MTVYVIADVKVTDDRWVPAYAASVHDIVHKHGGKYLARSGNVKTLEGKPLDTTLIALLQFPSAEAAEAFVSDPEYAPHAKARQSGSDSRFQLIDDISAERMTQIKQIQRVRGSRGMSLEGIVSKRLGSRYRSGRSKDWLKFKNPDAPAVKREAEEEWG